MPTYDYVCDGCGHAFEEWQSFKDDALTNCPKCAEPKLRRLFGGGAAIIFKGSGFYETDYRKESYKQAAKKESEAAKPAETPAATTPAATGGGSAASAPASPAAPASSSSNAGSTSKG
jgi:putative FmdB family regulatory protein